MSARQIAALLGSNPDDNNNNNQNQNQPHQQVVGASGNVNAYAHPSISAVVSLPLLYGNQHQHQQRFGRLQSWLGRST